MKRYLLPAIATLALASGIGVASAADHNAMNHNAMTRHSSMAKDNLSLTSSQQRLALKDISHHTVSQNMPAGFVPSVGTATPGTISLRTIPVNVSRRIPELKPYDYALLKNELLIVNPTDKKIVEIINRRA